MFHPQKTNCSTHKPILQKKNAVNYRITAQLVANKSKARPLNLCLMIQKCWK